MRSLLYLWGMFLGTPFCVGVACIALVLASFRRTAHWGVGFGVVALVAAVPMIPFNACACAINQGIFERGEQRQPAEIFSPALLASWARQRAWACSGAAAVGTAAVLLGRRRSRRTPASPPKAAP